MGGLDVAMNGQAAEYEIARGRPSMSSFHALFSAGALVASAAASWLIGIGYNHGSAAVIIAVVLLAAGVVAAFNLWPSEPSHRNGVRFALPHRALVTLGIITFLAFSAEGAVTDWSALYLHTNKAATLSAAAAGYIAFSIVMVACRLSGDRVVAVLGPVRTVLFGGIVVMLGTLIAVLAPYPLLSAIGFAIVGLGAANLAPVAFSASARTPGVSASVGTATVTTFGYSGALVFPALLGFIANAFGLSASLLVVVAMGAVISLMAGTVRR
jgi:hypothetical protein